MTVRRPRRFRASGSALGIVGGGRLGFVLFYDPGSTYVGCAGRRSSPLWQGGMSFHGGWLGVAAGGGAVRHWRRGVPVLVAGRRDLRRACADRPPARAGSPTSSTASCGAGPPTCRGRWRSRTAAPLPRHPSQLYEAALEGAALVRLAGAPAHAPAAHEARHARLRSSGAFCARLRRRAQRLPNCSASPTAQLGYARRGGMTMGMLLSMPLLSARPANVRRCLQHGSRGRSNRSSRHEHHLPQLRGRYGSQRQP